LLFFRFFFFFSFKSTLFNDFSEESKCIKYLYFVLLPQIIINASKNKILVIFVLEPMVKYAIKIFQDGEFEFRCIKVRDNHFHEIIILLWNIYKNNYYLDLLLNNLHMYPIFCSKMC